MTDRNQEVKSYDKFEAEQVQEARDGGMSQRDLATAQRDIADEREFVADGSETAVEAEANVGERIVDDILGGDEDECDDDLVL